MTVTEEGLEELRRFTITKEVTPLLRSILETMRKYGVPQYEWSELKPLVSQALTQSVNEFRKNHQNTDPEDKPGHSFEDQRDRLVSSLNVFDGAPFTLQRLCELILFPEEHYNSTKKLLFGLEKLVSVSTTLEVATEEEVKGLEVENEEIRKIQIPVRSSDAEVKEKDSDAEMKEANAGAESNANNNPENANSNANNNSANENMMETDS
uniref:Serine/threonine-protein phosphatase 4 regulatory subunit 2 n=1 Tax=Aplanochytrium stocchinoi TaxID=215587 RepID=A0A6S8BB95_9STRA|mmetsp:Transcript_8301/g.10498  ORF Transcript_8301/g.10498 Transcript_8301/m.10498 type:complete len:209 (+) Transcript_8301:138-764(+)